MCAILFYSCSSANGDGDDGNPTDPVQIIPTALNLEVTIVNADADNPNGDGSGKVQFSAIATDAIRYKFITGNGTEIESATGNAEFTYTQGGTNSYVVSVFAYSSTNHSISKFESINVYVEELPLELVWSDEFDVDGAISSSNWTAEIVPPNNGSWHNGEKQHYTDRLDNAYISDGTLKIVAKKETYTYQSSTKEYTSARIKTQDKQEFTYGRIDVRAKLPQGDGTWPAIWTLGANIDAVSWPACGEIDIMEHWAYNPGIVSSATHNTACSGGCSNVGVGETTLSDYATEFHVYSVVWTEDKLEFLIDGEFKYRYKPTPMTNENWPYTDDQFIILNIAMGGSWFTIDPNFTEAIMEIDYVRVYQ